MPNIRDLNVRGDPRQGREDWMDFYQPRDWVRPGGLWVQVLCGTRWSKQKAVCRHSYYQIYNNLIWNAQNLGTNGFQSPTLLLVVSRLFEIVGGKFQPICHHHHSDSEAAQPPTSLIILLTTSITQRITGDNISIPLTALTPTRPSPNQLFLHSLLKPPTHHQLLTDVDRGSASSPSEYFTPLNYSTITHKERVSSPSFSFQFQLAGTQWSEDTLSTQQSTADCQSINYQSRQPQGREGRRKLQRKIT